MGTIEIPERKNYWSLDIAKFLCAIMIISAHFASEWGSFPVVVDYAFSIYIIAVPFFFACSGFLFFNKYFSLNSKEEQKIYFIKYQKRLWTMYGVWTLVYLPFQVAVWIMKGEFVERLLRFIHSSLVIQTYATIWFIPALAVGIAATCFLVSKLGNKALFAVAAALYFFGMLGYTYNFLVEGTVIGEFYDVYLLIFKTTRNGIFNAIPFVFMGYCISRKNVSPTRKSAVKYGLLACVFLLLVVLESFILKFKFNVTGMDIGVFLVPFTYCFIMALLNVSLKDRNLWLWCRKLSLLIFVAQRLFLSAIPSVIYAPFEVLYSNPWIGLISVILITVGFSVCMIKLSEKFKFLKVFM